MNREETLAWIENILGALDKFEVIEIIEETISEGRVSDEFFETLDTETERLKAAGDKPVYDQLVEIARTVAIARQNRKEHL